MSFSRVVSKSYCALEFVGDLVKRQILVHRSGVGPEHLHFSHIPRGG